MFLWFGFVQGECRGRHTFWAHRGGGIAHSRARQAHYRAFPRQIYEKVFDCKVQISTNLHEKHHFYPYRIQNNGFRRPWNLFSRGELPPKPPYTARNFRQDTGRAREMRGHPWRAQGRTAGETGKSAAEKQKSATKNRKSAAEFIFSAALFRAIPGKVQIKAGHARQVP